MKRIIIIGEGPTEQAFINEVLQPHFIHQAISIENQTIKKSGGGIVSWPALKKQIEKNLLQPTAYVSLLIDYYGIEAKHQFPRWEASLAIADKNERMDFLEQAMANDLDEKSRYRFIPYLQLHEFEGLLFCNRQVFDDNFEEDEFLDYSYLMETLKESNPEMINNGGETAPSKRLEKIIKGYKKPVLGSLLAQEIGLSRIREKCPRFNAWITQLTNK
ncbi:DUF4276 family protein [Marinilabiliaceae bacterium JC017]|nr:DUF4276 family protein [Marinilabiliaceae bacterium JC017]